MHISPNRHPLLSWSSHPERPQQEVVALAMTHPAQIRVQARCRHVADWLRRGCREAGGRGANHQRLWGMTDRIMDSRKWIRSWWRRGGRIVSGGVRGMKMRRALDAEARHRVLTQFHASRLIQAGVSLLDRSGRPPVGRVDEPDPGIGRIRTHPILKVVDPATSSAPCNVCLAGKSTPPARLGTPKLRFPEPPSQTGLVDVVGHPR
jgi:hypothetical protein